MGKKASCWRVVRTLWGVAILLGSSYPAEEFRRPCGEPFIPIMERVQEFGLYANLLGNYPSLGIRQKLTVIWLILRL